jgi:hypothetical protein
VTTISDLNLYGEPIPDIVVILHAPHFKYQKMFGKNENLKFNEEKNKMTNDFDEIIRVSKTIFECKIKKNGSFEVCDSVSHTSIEILNKNISKSKYLRDLLKKEYNYTNRNLIRTLEIFKYATIFLKFSQIKSRSKFLFDTISKKRSNFDTSYWKKTSIFKIFYNFNKKSYRSFCLAINENYFLSLKHICLKEFEEHSIAKKSFVFLGTPYKSSCSYYDSSHTVFNSSSHKHCIRQCLRNYCEIKMNCSCFIFKRNEVINEIISQFDSTTYDICLKSKQYMLSFYDNYSKLCTHLCPIDCINDEFIITNQQKKKLFRIDSNIKEFSLKWDDTKPFIVYRETPVMTFTGYFCYIGGLFGMWFGISANQLFEKLIENYRIYYRDFIHFNLILFYNLLEILCYIKSKFQSIIRNIYS